MDMGLIEILFRRLAFLVSISLLPAIGAGILHAQQEVPGAVYAMTNRAAGNSVVAYRRAANGVLSWAQEVSTQGLGSGGGLGSQGALVLSDDGGLLLAVNAGSNEISALAATNRGLQFVSKASSGGIRPVSVTVHKGLVYVVNAGGTPNITGFTVSPFGQITSIAGSTVALAGGPGAGPAQVEFSPDGSVLLVTEKTTGLIDIFSIGDDGHATGPTTQVSNNPTPFGFEFAPHGLVVVSEAVGGAPGASTLSSYQTTEQVMLDTISKSVPDTQTAACWVAITNSGRFAFTSNTGSGSISSYTLASDGELSLSAAIAGSTGAGSGPTDMALSRNSQFLYVLAPGTGNVAGFHVSGGTLTPAANVSGLPASSTGIAAR